MQPSTPVTRLDAEKLEPVHWQAIYEDVREIFWLSSFVALISVTAVGLVVMVALVTA